MAVQSSTKVLETQNITASMGLVQALRKEPTRKYSSNVDDWVKISVPLGHVTLIGFLSVVYPLPCRRGCSVRLYGGGKSEKNVLWDVKRQMPSVEAFDASVLFIRFKALSSAVSVNFRLLYSFHHRSRQPFRLADGLWNCSVPEWPEFRRHFLCNLQRECEEREDEAQCPYAGHCGQGRLTLADRCYEYVSEKVSRSWLETNVECRRRGGYLASLNTPDEWESVVTILKMRGIVRDVLVGLRDTSPVMPTWYRNTFMWEDRTLAYFTKVHWIQESSDNNCGRFQAGYYERINKETRCRFKFPGKDFLCELTSRPDDLLEERNAGEESQRRHVIQLSIPRNETASVQSVSCPGGHVTHAFLACDVEAECLSSLRYADSESEAAWGIPSRTSCPAAEMMSLPAMFTCRSGLQIVPYTLVCDHRRQCAEGSDEDFCVFPVCSSSTPLKCGSSSECVSPALLCDGQDDCSNGVDELECSSIMTHFQCPENGYCLPVFLRCNTVNDCPGREDETGCDRLSCPGMYLCRGSKVCLHPSHVCDDMYHCPQKDDEVLCRLACPADCTCLGLQFTCHRHILPAERHPEVRYLDASSSGLTLEDLTNNVMLIHLGLSRCRLKNLLYNVTFPHLHSLDLSYNELYTVRTGQFRGMPNIQRISLSNNPLKSVFSPDAEQHTIPTLRRLDLSGVRMPTLITRRFSPFPGLHTLNLSHCRVSHVAGEGLGLLTQLRVLDVEGCPLIQFPRHLLSELSHLQAVLADNFKVCCADMLPTGFNLANCQAPVNEVSSCQSLLRNDGYRVLMCIFCSLALLGNISCFLFRRFLLKSSSVSAFGVFVSHLSISDFLMGVYLGIIGVADRLYEGSYLWHDVLWRDSIACKVAGFTSILSNEVSAFIICLITLDRFLVLRFPFSSLHFKTRSAHVTCAVIWVIVTTVAVIPLTPMTSHWSFYSQTGICIPLPVTRRSFGGHHYAFGVLIVFNFVLFLFIAAGQAAIYDSIRANSLSTADSTKKSNDLRIARRLITVAVSDFSCWFPIGLLGLMASSGVPIPGEVNVGMAILVLPLNSALNPFIYTVNVLLERRQKSRDKEFLKQFKAQIDAHV